MGTMQDYYNEALQVGNVSKAAESIFKMAVSAAKELDAHNGAINAEFEDRAEEVRDLTVKYIFDLCEVASKCIAEMILEADLND